MRSSLQAFLTMSWKVAKRYDQFLSKAAASYGLTRNEKDVLLFLHNNMPLDTAGDIVKYRCIAKSLVAKSVASLTERGMLSQRPDTEDARFVHLSITDTATGALRELQEAQHRFLVLYQSALAPEEWHVFADMLTRIGKHMEADL